MQGFNQKFWWIGISRKEVEEDEEEEDQVKVEGYLCCSISPQAQVSWLLTKLEQNPRNLSTGDKLS